MLDRSTAEGQLVESSGPAGWPILLLASAALVSLVCAVFWPILGFEFVDIDVGQQVVDNPYIRGLTGENLKHIFSSRCIYSYYPIRSLTYAIDYHFWGLNPTGFKLTNGLIHTANVLLVFWLILRLFRHPASAGRSTNTWRDVFAATVSAGIFAVHPVVVEPVAWVAGREELLMTLGALGCFHFHLTARRLGEEGAKPGWALACYVGAALCCAVACLSNAVAAVIPLLITAWDVLTLNGPGEACIANERRATNGSPGPRALKVELPRTGGTGINRLRKIVWGTSALWLVAAATIVIKKTGANTEAVAAEPAVSSAERIMLILNVYWLNLKTLVWPTKLAVSRSPVRPESLLTAEVILGAVAVGLTLLIVWSLRRRKLILYGLVWFGLALAPASQIMPHHVHRADRFLYLPLVGLVVAMAIGLRPLVNALRGRVRVAGSLAAAVLGALLLVTVSAGQVQTWRSSITMWENCLRVDPNNATAHDLFGNLLKNRGQLDRAMQHYKRAMELDSDDQEMLHVVAMQLASFGDEQLRNYPEAIRLATRACELSQWEEPRYIRGLATVYSCFAETLAASGSFGPAIQNYGDAVKVDPGFDPALYNLALLRATCPDTSLRRPDEAVRLAERALELTEKPGAEHLRILAEVYASAGRSDESVTAAEKAIGLAQAAGNWELAAEIRAQFFSGQIPPKSFR